MKNKKSKILRHEKEYFFLIQEFAEQMLCFNEGHTASYLAYFGQSLWDDNKVFGGFNFRGSVLGDRPVAPTMRVYWGNGIDEEKACHDIAKQR